MPSAAFVRQSSPRTISSRHSTTTKPPPQFCNFTGCSAACAAGHCIYQFSVFALQFLYRDSRGKVLVVHARFVSRLFYTRHQRYVCLELMKEEDQDQYIPQ